MIIGDKVLISMPDFSLNNAKGEIVMIYPKGMLVRDEVYKVRLSEFRSGQFLENELVLIKENINKI